MYIKGIYFNFLIFSSTWEWTNMFPLCKCMFIIIATIQNNDLCSRMFTHLAFAVESLLLVELSTHLHCKLSSMIRLWWGGGGLSASDAWPASGMWDSPYSSGNSVHIDSKGKYLWTCREKPLAGLWSWTCHSKGPFLNPFLLKEVCCHPQHYCCSTAWFPKLLGVLSLISQTCTH